MSSFCKTLATTGIRRQLPVAAAKPKPSIGNHRISDGPSLSIIPSAIIAEIVPNVARKVLLIIFSSFKLKLSFSEFFPRIKSVVEPTRVHEE